MSVPSELVDFIKQHKKFIVVGHKEPDGDCIGSQLALASVLKRLKKEVILCSSGPFKRSEVLQYKDLFHNTLSTEELAGACLIVVDCAGSDRIGDLAETLAGLPSAIIDHHAVGQVYPPNSPVFVEPLAPAVTLLVHKLIKALGLEPTESEAKQLFFGLCTDTGFFRHLDSRGSEALALASELVRQGASPKEVYGLMYGGKSLESRQLLGLMLARSQLYFDGKLAFCTEEYEETQHFGLENRDSDMLYQLLQSIDSVQAIAVLRQETLTSCAVGLRSRDAVDVSKIAGHFGGGGHKNAAGFNANGRINAIKSLVLNAFAEVFDFKKISL